MQQPLYLGIDVGTGSVRACSYTPDGTAVRRGEHPIKIRNRQPHHYEQSTDDIWNALKQAVSAASGKEANRIAAIGIDATCSLVAVNANDHKPVSVVHGDDEDDGEVWNVILWLDHRAEQDAATINNSKHPAVLAVRNTFGGKLSPENEPPKIRFLARTKPDAFIENTKFFDLADYLVFRCTANPDIRSACTVSCKWGWGAREGNGGWDPEFWHAIGVNKLPIRNIGRDVRAPGLGAGQLCPAAVEELGIGESCTVAVPMIDAHCGAVGILGADMPSGDGVTGGNTGGAGRDIANRVAVLAGTSTCYIAVNEQSKFVEGVWGPFRDAVLPGTYCTEAGQSVSGHLLKHLVEGHPAYSSIVSRVGDKQSSVFKELNNIVESLLKEAGDEEDPARNLHMLDSFAGNRSPFADPSFRGAIVGLELSNNERDLAILYRAAAQGLCYGARLIIERMNKNGHRIDSIFVSGGLASNEMYLALLADITKLPVVRNMENDPTLLGGAILAATAHSKDPDMLIRFMQYMSRVRDVVQPTEKFRNVHEKKFQVYQLLHEHFLQYQAIMNQ